jgi:hypothetical protein
VLVEFDRFITAGHLEQRVNELDAMTHLASLASFKGMHV